jgi:hypothetical protein
MPKKQMCDAKCSWSKTCTSFSGYFFSLLFGIDFAGGKVIMDPIVPEEPSYEEN